MLETSLDASQIRKYLTTQLLTFFPDNQSEADLSSQINAVVPIVLQRLERCFDANYLKYYRDGRKPFFNHLHGDHYAMFLYLVSNQAANQGAPELAQKAFLLNKSLHGIDAFFGVVLPEVFLFVHPLGSVLGSARYEDYVVIYQGVTVGSTYEGVYPTLRQGCVLLSGAKVIGDCQVGRNVTLAANAFIQNQNVPDNVVVVGQYPTAGFKPNKHDNISLKYGQP